MQLADLPNEFENIAIDVVIAPNIDWPIQDLTEENDALGRFNIAMTLRNDGNAADGIIVQLQCSHFTPMTLIPPLNSVTEPGVEFPRSFESTILSSALTLLFVLGQRYQLTKQAMEQCTLT